MEDTAQLLVKPLPASQGQERPPTPLGGGGCPHSSHTSQRVVGVEPQSKVPEAGEQLRFYLPGGGVVHALQAEGQLRGCPCPGKEPQLPSFKPFGQNLPRTPEMTSQPTSGDQMGRQGGSPGRETGLEIFHKYLRVPGWTLGFQTQVNSARSLSPRDVRAELKTQETGNHNKDGSPDYGRCSQTLDG